MALFLSQTYVQTTFVSSCFALLVLPCPCGSHGCKRPLSLLLWLCPCGSHGRKHDFSICLLRPWMDLCLPAELLCCAGRYWGVCATCILNLSPSHDASCVASNKVVRMCPDLISALSSPQCPSPMHWPRHNRPLKILWKTPFLPNRWGHLAHRVILEGNKESHANTQLQEGDSDLSLTGPWLWFRVEIVVRAFRRSFQGWG